MRIIEELRICAPKGTVPDSSTLLTYFDFIYIDLEPIKTCYFFSYPHSASHFLESHLPNIKRSLSIALQHFYPFAGKLRLTPGSEEQYEIYYKDGDSVPLLIAESEDNFLEASGINPREASKVQTLVPCPTADDLLAVQITLFPGHGICMGLHIHHVACDGFSLVHFVKSWATICMAGTGPLPSITEPSIDGHRAVLLNSFHDQYIGYLKARTKIERLLRGKSETKSSTFSAVLRISYEEIEMLKASVQAKAKLLGKTLAHCSTYVVSSSYTWLCHRKLRGCSDDQKVCLSFPVDWRRRLDPPAPAMYFGNCVLQSLVEMKAEELVEPEFGLMLACEAMGNRIKELESGDVRRSLKGLDRFVANLDAGIPIFNIGCSNKFGMYGVDFGLGRPAKVQTFLDKEECFTMAENGDDNRGVQIAVLLPKHEMEEFVTIFRTGLTHFFH